MDMIDQQIRQFLGLTLCVVLAVLLLSIFAYYYYVRRILIRPLRILHHAAIGLVENRMEDLSHFRVDVNTGDELEELAHSFQYMVSELNEYIQNLSRVTAEKERIGAELDVARHIQASMLPCIFPAFPERHEFDIYASMTPAKEVGGDFYDFFLVDDDHLALVMADVSGKGVPAALFMMISKTLLKSAAQSGLSPKAVLEKVNDQLCENNDAEMFVTVWLGILEISTGKMKCANAGHEYPAIMRKGSSFELFKDRHGFVLAGMEGARYREYELDLDAGDRLVVYTDGVPEATNASNTLYGTDRMLCALNAAEGGSCRQLLEALHRDVDEFAGGADQFDDITMLCIEMKSSGMKKINLAPTLEQLPQAFAALREPPDLVVCDSQVVHVAARLTPPSVPLTTFSILMARAKGDLVALARGAAALTRLQPGQTVLVQEACSHHAQKDDIGRVKIPRLLARLAGGPVETPMLAGKEFTEYAGDAAAVVHCGACAITRGQMLARLDEARAHGLPMTNYGMCISFVQGVLERVLTPFPEALAAFREKFPAWRDADEFVLK